MAAMEPLALRARAWVATHGSIAATTRPLVAWAAAPRHAPDAAVKGRHAATEAWEHDGETPAGPVAEVPGVPLWRRLARVIRRRLGPIAD